MYISTILRNAVPLKADGTRVKPASCEQTGGDKQTQLEMNLPPGIYTLFYLRFRHTVCPGSSEV